MSLELLLQQKLRRKNNEIENTFQQLLSFAGKEAVCKEMEPIKSAEHRKPPNAKPLHSIADIVRDTGSDKKLSNNTSSFDLLAPNVSKSAFQLHSSRALHSLDIWKHHQMFLPSMYAFPMTTTCDHVTARQASTALALHCHNDTRFCSS